MSFPDGQAGRAASGVETEGDWLFVVAQQEHNRNLVDTEDGVQRAAAFLQGLVASGL